MRMPRALFMTLGLAAACLVPGHARADAGLQLNPLKYEDAMATTTPKQGFIDVGNPSDTSVMIRTHVQGFRQADLDGNLAFYDDDRLAAGIKPDLDEFQLGPRESLRLSFTIDPAKLPKGGVYAVIFLQTVPPPGAGSETFISESASVGTLLILRNGAGTTRGAITRLDIPWLQIGGHGLAGQIRFANPNRADDAVAITPKLSSKVWGLAPATTEARLVLPGAERVFGFARQGTFLGLLPVTVRDAVTGVARTQWVFAVTGAWAWLLLVLITVAAIEMTWRGLRHVRHLRHHYDWAAHAARQRRRKLGANAIDLSQVTLD